MEQDKIIIKEGYCCSCANNPEDVCLTVASKQEGNPCNGCWFSEEKSNWIPMEV